ncbi:hypothetical protein AOXY_G6118 [Acipenser oxyrinchus oxyrinchus]|uniref:Uncharacterized protein n=1 Tax=Acipenser oxyrinchus oxyrinchus TaxID=40147 RepID=A0AAD8GBU3_ACIOX|nr:hypothetical protein AOXY_G6118 [Acipenser oxyrinchus oxyrinchus]
MVAVHRGLGEVRGRGRNVVERRETGSERLAEGSSGWWLIGRERSSRERLSYQRRGVRLRTKRVGGRDPGSVGFTPGLFLCFVPSLCSVRD